MRALTQLISLSHQMLRPGGFLNSQTTDTQFFSTLESDTQMPSLLVLCSHTLRIRNLTRTSHSTYHYLRTRHHPHMPPMNPKDPSPQSLLKLHRSLPYKVFIMSQASNIVYLTPPSHLITDPLALLQNGHTWISPLTVRSLPTWTCGHCFPL